LEQASDDEDVSAIGHAGPDTMSGNRRRGIDRVANLPTSTMLAQSDRLARDGFILGFCPMRIGIEIVVADSHAIPNINASEAMDEAMPASLGRSIHRVS
jgi:hypothetical protein